MENITKPRLRDLPHTPTRGQVYTIFCKLPKKTVYDEINATMIQYRSTDLKTLTEEDVKLKRSLLHPEWVIILKFLGIPEGYKKPEWLQQ